MRLADQYAVWFTPLTLLMCGFGWFVTGDPHTIVAVLVVATPCPLILATPIAVISGINRAAQQSIIVKGGTASEQVGRTRAVAFDKTGTLTLGIPALARIVSANGRTPDELLATAASVEQLSSHLRAQVTVRRAASAELAPPGRRHPQDPEGGDAAVLPQDSDQAQASLGARMQHHRTRPHPTIRPPGLRLALEPPRPARFPDGSRPIV